MCFLEEVSPGWQCLAPLKPQGLNRLFAIVFSWGKKWRISPSRSSMAISQLKGYPVKINHNSEIP
jgi:hypothetical protein